ncbi:hypothetical protein [Dysgonomonas sp. 25]|uniref:hypothetical protein n=1 Tax=Dysgonomonas sp. 25 TaxID=2302933 RepID=UPI0013D856FC|nr:hypothetical protein [Dysgonomonas sp. 25]NDV67571.1 hypothetical protein [Dysgonomonas sp. 25]
MKVKFLSMIAVAISMFAIITLTQSCGNDESTTPQKPEMTLEEFVNSPQYQDYKAVVDETFDQMTEIVSAMSAEEREALIANRHNDVAMGLFIEKHNLTPQLEQMQVKAQVVSGMYDMEHLRNYQFNDFVALNTGNSQLEEISKKMSPEEKRQIRCILTYQDAVTWSQIKCTITTIACGGMCLGEALAVGFTECALAFEEMQRCIN